MIYRHISAQLLQLPAISQCFIYVEKGINTNYDIALALCCNTNVADYKKEETGCIEFIGYQSDLLPTDF
ncbi:MAG: hypothetical protein EBS30_13400 [Planctomycetes bacterium]|nr:hypothetical protein [Planctomycetota bacterium]